MSWSVNACGPAAQIAEQLEQQFQRINMSDPGEQATVQNVRVLVKQTLETIDPAKPVSVTGSGSMGYKNYTTKEGPYQSFDLKIAPIHFST